MYLILEYDSILLSVLYIFNSKLVELKSSESQCQFPYFDWTSQWNMHGGDRFIDVEKEKLKSPRKRMEVEDVPITPDSMIVKDHLFGDVLAIDPIDISHDAFISCCPDRMLLPRTTTIWWL